MNIQTYIGHFKKFANMDFNKNWVALKKSEIMVDNESVVVWIPQVKSKGYMICRWICKIINYIRGKNPHLELVHQLINSIKAFKSNAGATPQNLKLQKKVMEKALQLLKKFEKQKHLEPYIISNVNKDINTISKEIESNSKEIKPSVINIENHASSQDELGEENKLKKDINAISTEIEFSAIDHENDTSSPYELGKKNLELAFSIDWDKENPLFDTSFVQSWISGNKSEGHWFYKDEMDNSCKVPLSKEILAKNYEFINFLINLLNTNDSKLSSVNQNHLSKMLCSIMNSIKQSDNFQVKYKKVVSEICHALKNCSNAQNTAIESLFYEFVSPTFESGHGMIHQKVKHRLQMLRNLIFKEAIAEVIQSDPKKEYYGKHETATYNHYYGLSNLCEQFGLPKSVSTLDQNFKKYALKDKENDITKKFKQKYNPTRIIDTIYNAVWDAFDNTVPTALFTEWILKQNVDQDILDENGKYQKWCVEKLLEELEIIKTKS